MIWVLIAVCALWAVFIGVFAVALCRIAAQADNEERERKVP